MGSESGTMTKDDWLKSLRGLLYTSLGALAGIITVWSGGLNQNDPKVMLVVVVASWLSNVIKRWAVNSTTTVSK